MLMDKSFDWNSKTSFSQRVFDEGCNLGLGSWMGDFGDDLEWRQLDGFGIANLTVDDLLVQVYPPRPDLQWTQNDEIMSILRPSCHAVYLFLVTDPIVPPFKHQPICKTFFNIRK